MVNKIYYNLDGNTKNIVLELVRKAQELDLGNVSFSYYGDTEINFYMTEYKTYWELVVKHKQARLSCSRKVYFNVADIYKVKDDQIIYDYSEEDLE